MLHEYAKRVLRFTELFSTSGETDNDESPHMPCKFDVRGCDFVLHVELENIWNEPPE
jgi:hypothetical protein